MLLEADGRHVAPVSHLVDPGVRIVEIEAPLTLSVEWAVRGEKLGKLSGSHRQAIDLEGGQLELLERSLVEWPVVRAEAERAGLDPHHGDFLPLHGARTESPDGQRAER